MGLDGGTIPTRGELVRMKQKPEKKDPNSEREHKRSNCSISHQALVKPMFLCHLGMLYNQNSIYKLLKTGSTSAEFNHITSFRDVKIPKLKTGEENYACPITGLDMNGRVKFIMLWTCGCVLSERALKTIKSKSCLLCNAEFTRDDVVIINPNDEEREQLLTSIIHRRTRPIQDEIVKGGSESITTDQRPQKPKQPRVAETPSTSTVSVSNQMTIVTFKDHIDLERSRSPEMSTSKELKRHYRDRSEHKTHKKHKKHKHHKHHKLKHQKKGRKTTGGHSSSGIHPGWGDLLKSHRR